MRPFDFSEGLVPAMCGPFPRVQANWHPYFTLSYLLQYVSPPLKQRERDTPEGL